MTALRRAIGCMTGTSLDGLDVALVTTKGHGLDLEIDAMELASESPHDFAIVCLPIF